MLTCLCLLLAAASAALDAPTVIRPGTPVERDYLVEERSVLREIGYDPLCPFIRVADQTMHYTYCFAPGRGHRAWLLIGVSSQFLISARGDREPEWRRVADMDEAEYCGTRVLVDLTGHLAESDAVLVRFEDKHPADGWGALLSELLYYHDDQPGPLRLDVPDSGLVEAPAAWAGQPTAVYLPNVTGLLRGVTLNGRQLTPQRTPDGGWWADATAALRPGANRLAVDGQVAAPPRLGLKLPTCAVPPSSRPNRRFAPYQPEHLDCLAGNYLQCLLDARYDLLAFTAGERQPIHFVHDSLRCLSALAEEARRTPVSRPELARRLFQGCRAAILPGGEDLFAFKHDERPLDIRPLPESADLTLVHKVDVTRTVAAVGVELPDATVTDTPPVTSVEGTRFERTWSAPGRRLAVRAFYPPGDADRAPRFEFVPDGPTTLRIGRLARSGMWFQPGSWGPEAVVAPDGTTQWAHQGEPRVDPRQPYLLLRGGNTGQQTYCRALLVAWDRAPERIRLVTVAGGRQGTLIDEVRLDFAGKAPVGLVVYPFAGQTETLATARAIAESLRRTGRLGCGRLDPVETASACALGPEGIAAAAWLMRREGLPEAGEAEALAQRLMRSTTDLDRAGTHSAELYNLIDAPRYLAELGHREWLPWLTVWGERILAMQLPDGSYPWLDQQLRMCLALLKLHESTGEQRYRDAFDRAMATVAYRDGRLVWKGQPQEAGDFAGALTVGLYGRLGRRDLVETVLSVRTAYIDDRGFQACSDLNPYMLGWTSGLGPASGRRLRLGLGQFALPTAQGPVLSDRPTAYVVNPYRG